MTDGDFAVQYKVYHLEQFRASGLSQRAYCAQKRTPSRKSLRRWQALFDSGGNEALRSRRPRRTPHNRTAPEEEAIILDYVKDNPAHGPQRIANQLADRVAVGHTGVYGVLKRHGLNKRKARLEWARLQHGQIITQSELETAREKAKSRHVEVAYPGELWGVDTFLIGRIKGVGKVYHCLAIDLASGFAIAMLCLARNAKNACEFLRNHLLPKARGLGVHRLLLDNGTEFTAARWRDSEGRANHPFHHLAERLGIELTFIKPNHPWTNGACERLHQTLLHEFYQPAFCRKVYQSLEELEYDLQLFLHWYNYERTHQGHRLKGRVPAQVYLCGKTSLVGFVFRAA
jgi:transposase InsO family protein